MNFGVVALITWLTTATLGGIMVYLWVARSLVRAANHVRVHSPGKPPPYIPRPLVVVHVLLSMAGLGAWVGALEVEDELAWPALAAAVVVALIGMGMFVRWLGSRRARRAARAVSGAPSESRLPVVVVYSHGMLGLATVLFLILSYFHPANF